MLKSITLTNFKCFKEPATIELAPITLVFGANSSGKSSILQVFNLLRQTLDFGTADKALVLFAEEGYTNCGSFRELLFDHGSQSDSLRIRLDVDLSKVPMLDSSHLWFRTIEAESAGLEITFSTSTGRPAFRLTGFDFYVDSETDPVASFRYVGEVDNNDATTQRTGVKSSEDEYRCVELSHKPRFWRLHAIMDSAIPESWKNCIATIESVNREIVAFDCEKQLADIAHERQSLEAARRCIDTEVTFKSGADRDLAEAAIGGKVAGQREEERQVLEKHQQLLQRLQEAYTSLYECEQCGEVREYVRNLARRVLSRQSPMCVVDYGYTGREYFLLDKSFSQLDLFEKYADTREVADAVIGPWKVVDELLCRKYDRHDDFTSEDRFEREFARPWAIQCPLDAAFGTALIIAANLRLPYSTFGPLRCTPQRSYKVSDHAPLRRERSGKNFAYQLYRDRELIERTNSWLKKLGICYEIDLSALGTGESNEFMILLKDTQRPNTARVNLSDVGFGVSQLLPIIVQCLAESNQTVVIEQPELHIHPRLQAEFGSFLAETKKEPLMNRYIVETHSEHLVLRLQRLVREKNLTPRDVSILFVSRTPNGSSVKRIHLDENGDFLDDWPEEFFPERLRELGYDWA